MRMVERVFAVASLLLLMMVVAILVFWQFFDAPAQPITVEWSKTDRTVYAQGDTMHITRMMCVNTPVGYTVRRAFIDHIVYQLADYPTQVHDPGCKVRSISIEIPTALPPGEYIYRVWADFQFNPIKRVRVDYPDLPTITVVERRAAS